MDVQFTNEKQLLADIDHLREQFPQTQDLYREVCTLLFFRYGMTPTANKLYQLVRKGSMTAPADALAKFWEDLREKSRVRIEHPDLPDALKTAAGELTATLWSSAQAMAHETLHAYQQEALASVADAKASSFAAEASIKAANEALEKLQIDLRQATARNNTLEQKLAAVEATNAALDAHLAQARLDKAAYQQRLEDARREFSAELDKLRASARLAEDRLGAAEKRALLEIDRERVAVTRLQKELDAGRTTAAQTAERSSAELAALQTQLGNIRQNAGVLEGSLHAVTANRDQLSNELLALREKLVSAERALSEPRQALKPARAARSKKITGPGTSQE